ncbi:MAG TPA: COX15/CtaA family protein [Burkholderiales bacterium]
MATKSRPVLFFRTALFAVAFALTSVVFGAYMRISEARLGCPDGPACAAQPTTPAAAQSVHAANSANGRAWKDTLARYIAGTLGLLLVRLAVLGWQMRRRPGQQVLIPASTLVLVFGLTIIGIVTIDLQSKPLVMMIQLLGNLLVLALLWWIVLREQRLFRSVAVTPLTRRLRWRAAVSLVIGMVAITLGGWSMVNHAALACPDFPTCQGAYWPSVDFGDGLLRWTFEGLGYDRTELGLSAAAAIHIAHRAAALIAALYLGWFSLHLLRVGIQDAVCRYGLLLLVMLSFAIAFGIMESVGGLPLLLGVTHNAVAALLLLTLVTVYHVLRAPPRGSR